ncbi:MAG: SPOR domain-containing protein [Clostridia bacterium]|nr:SPOR domain-containing protein [Clostridia bacterium]
MEYRRRRSRRSTRGAYRSAQYSRNTGGGSGALNIILLAFMTAGLVYAFVATPVGAMIAQNVFGKARNASVSPTPEVIVTPESGAEPTPQNTEATVKAEVALPPLELYSLQLGVYDSAANAQGLISSLRSLGAAGYALASEAGVRILASCYTTEAAANSVCERLKGQGYSGLVYPLKCDGVILTVTANELQLSAIRDSIELSKQLVDRLNDEVIRFDSEERSIEYGIAIANEMLERVRSARSALAEISDISGSIKLIEEHFIELTGCFTRFTAVSSENRVEFSGRLKHLQIEVIERYSALASKLQSAANQ